jgi:serine/threonine protein kinase
VREKPGNKLGPYTLLRRLAVGGQGEVWVAVGAEGSAEVAVKVINGSHPKKKARFRQELERHRALTGQASPHIMPLLAEDIQELSGDRLRGYLVMPLARGTLASLEAQAIFRGRVDHSP